MIEFLLSHWLLVLDKSRYTDQKIRCGPDGVGFDHPLLAQEKLRVFLETNKHHVVSGGPSFRLHDDFDEPQ